MIRVVHAHGNFVIEGLDLYIRIDEIVQVRMIK